MSTDFILVKSMEAQFDLAEGSEEFAKGVIYKVGTGNSEVLKDIWCRETPLMLSFP